jgi:hypothetical protein
MIDGESTDGIECLFMIVNIEMCSEKKKESSLLVLNEATAISYGAT